ncbi:MAG: putative tricarboxylic transport rane protein [Alphaproteobacteria bacterium]|nr:putative tricarboxylic transport rane protein [Alphaproteobacteria bacterium]
MILRRDHVAGGIFVIGGALVFAVSDDLPWGSMAMPGAGMLPKLLIGFMILFGLILVARAGDSPPLATIAWSDLPHALCVAGIAAAAIALYTMLGFVVTMALMLFVLLVGVEHRNVVSAAAFSIGVTVFAYLLFGTLLKSPLPPSPFGF